MQLCKKVKGILHGQVIVNKKRKSISHGLGVTDIDQHQLIEENNDEVR